MHRLFFRLGYNDAMTLNDLLHDYPVVVELAVAWGDMDAYGHVNNVVYFRYFEQARIAYLDSIGWLQLKESIGHGPIVASTHAHYRRPLRYPDRIAVGARLVRMETDRITLKYALASQSWNAIAAEGEVVVVSYDYSRNQKMAIPEAVRQAILTLEGHVG